MTAAGAPSSRPRPPRALAVSDRRALPAGTGWDAHLRALAADRLPALQLREKDLDDRALYELALASRALLPPPALLLVNGRFDLALAAGADGVHLPSDGLPTAAVARFAERRGGLLVGRSTHRAEEVEAARRDGADYVTFGPVWATPGKERYGEPAGLDALAAVSRLGVPVLALGGVTSGERVAAVAAAGAWGVAGIRAFADAGSRRELLAAARDAWGEAAWAGAGGV